MTDGRQRLAIAGEQAMRLMGMLLELRRDPRLSPEQRARLADAQTYVGQLALDLGELVPTLRRSDA